MAACPKRVFCFFPTSSATQHVDTLAMGFWRVNMSLWIFVYAEILLVPFGGYDSCAPAAGAISFNGCRNSLYKLFVR